jgi:hypothetical protein
MDDRNIKTTPMNEEQKVSNEASKADVDTSAISAGEGTLQTKEEFENEKDNYYDVDKPKKDAETNIGDGEMRNEGTVGDGDLPDETLFSIEDSSEQQNRD